VPHSSRRTFLAGSAAVLAGLVRLPARSQTSAPVRIGILHSQTGDMALSERPLIDAAQLAIAQINARGGLVVGKERRQIQPVVVDGRSDPATFAAQARQLKGVASLFGCWTSQCRKAVLPVLVETGTLLWYPVQYEGEEKSEHVIYTGPVANQQLYPALDFLAEQCGPRLFLLGSDYIYPRVTHKMARKQWRGEIVGEAYAPLGCTDFAGIRVQIRRARPQAILSTLNGGSNLAFFSQTPAAPVMSLSISEVEIQEMKRQGHVPVDHYAAWGYFMSLDQASNRRFLRSFRQRYGQDRVTSAPVAAAYSQVLAFARAVERAGSLEASKIRQAARGMHYLSPSGLSRIDPENLHTWNPMHIGQINADGQFSVVWNSELPLRPEPYSR